MDENKTMNQNPEVTGEKTFTQEDVNGIVSRRLAEEKAKSDKALAERERELNQREMLLNAKEKMTALGLPMELLDALNVSSPEALEKSMNTVSAVINKIKAEAPPRTFRSARAGESGQRPELTGNSSLRKAMGLPG